MPMKVPRRKRDSDTMGVSLPWDIRNKVEISDPPTAINTTSPVSLIRAGPTHPGYWAIPPKAGDPLSITLCRAPPEYKNTPQPKLFPAASVAKLDTNTMSPLLLICEQHKPPPKKRLDDSGTGQPRSEEHTSELQSQFHLVCRLLLEKKKKIDYNNLDQKKKTKKKDK